MNVPATKSFSSPGKLLLFATILFFFVSCSVVKKYPIGKPFVYETNIELQGKFSTDEAKNLRSKLKEQLHDSVQVRSVQKLIGWENGPRFLYSVLPNPPVYDSLNADKSIVFMRALLNSLGYYRDTITYDTSLQINADQQRTTINFRVTPGKLFKIDSIVFNMGNDTLQTITDANLGESLIKKGSPFAIPLISSEFDRLSDIYRNNGYLRFSREELLAVWDTVGIALLRFTLDPIAQAQQLAALRSRRLNPIADLEIRLRPNPDTSHLIRYYVGDVTVYPDLRLDSSLYIPSVNMLGQYKIVSYKNLFKRKMLVENIYLNRGDLYSQRNYLRTLNRFNSLGAWRLTSIDQVPRPSTDTVDFVVKLTPAPKYIFDANLEGSQNWGTAFTEGNLIGVNFGLQNRNFARGANQANTSFRFGTELAPDRFVQTKQISFGHFISFPRVIPKFKFIPPALKENFRTTFAFNANYTSRVDFFKLFSLNSSWGYEFNWKKKLLSLRIPNIEYSFLDRGIILTELINTNQSYRYIFNDGLVSSVISSLTATGGKKDITNFARFNVEASGLLTGLIRSNFLDSNLYRFIRLDADFRQTHTIRRSAFAWRVFAGAGYELASTHYFNDQYLPFFKAYFAGGANSMRAWPLRKLGPGSSVKSFERNIAPDRFGDIQIEMNAEYRFYLTEISGIKLNSVLFIDIGNIWNLRYNPDFPGGEFKFNKLLKDFAVGAGTGLRIDFGLFLVRLDIGYKLKDPSPADIINQNKFFPYKNLFKDAQLQLGVTYPF